MVAGLGAGCFIGFKAMFSNKDYVVDEEVKRFEFFNPSALQHGSWAMEKEQREQQERNSDAEYLEQFELVEDGHERGGRERGSEGLWSDEDYKEEEREEDVESKRRPNMYEIGAVG
ncbi:hypothetical protein FGB62_139g018 [Gracilaria domingensis]|nr:hypothetical protein FGB62_139g018 [Gracilaria domingensis]